MATGCVAIHERPLGNFPSHQVAAKVSPTFTSTDLFTPFSQPRNTLPSIAEFVRPSYGKSNPWGTATTTYGGLGPSVDEVKESRTGSTSRSHRHYGTGCCNFYAPPQPYTVTNLSLSQCRPCDQLLPKPLITAQVVNRQLQERYPKNGAYTSHVSKFGVFPAATANYNTASADSQGLTHRTVRALRQLHSDLYCTTMYEHFSAHAIQRQHKVSNADTAHPLASSTTAPIGQQCHDGPDTVLEDRNSEIEDTEKGVVVVSTSTETGDKAMNRDGHFGTVSAGEGTGAEDTDEETKLMEDSMCDEDDQKDGDTSKEERDVSEDQESPSLLSSPGVVCTTFTRLPKLPDHFHRITSKHTQNISSPPWPCCAPYYLLRHHSLLPSSITSLPDGFPKANSFPVESRDKGVNTRLRRRSCQGSNGDSGDGVDGSTITGKTPLEKSSSSGGLMPRIAKNCRGRLVASQGSECAQSTTEGDKGEDCKLPRLSGSPSSNGEAAGCEADAQEARLSSEGGDGMYSASEEPQEIPSLSSMLLPAGSHVPHSLGLRYKTKAHMRYHMLYPDQVPDLRDSRTSGKKYFFYNYHASAFRG